MALQNNLVRVNNIAVSDLKYALRVGDVILVDKTSYIVPDAHIEKRVVAFHKPVGYLCSKDRSQGQTIYDILPDWMQHYQYIGRLDKDSRWLLLLTNNYPLVHQLSHPRFGLEKVYMVRVDRMFSDDHVKACLDGVLDQGDLLKALTISYDGDVLCIVLGEWKNRHIRRMLAVLGYKVLDLCRIQEASIYLDDLPAGSWKDITWLLSYDAQKNT